MGRHRYDQFCPLARATEIVGERWTLLIVRELLLGPRRFSDLLAPLSGISSSVLSERLASLEFRAYAVAEGLPDGVTRQWEVLEQLRAWGFLVTPESRTCADVEAAVALYEELLETREFHMDEVEDLKST